MRFIEAICGLRPSTRPAVLVWLLLGFMWCPIDAVGADLSLVRHFFPDPAAVTIETVRGSPPSAIVRSSDGIILGYAFSTYDVSGSVGYSGHPIDIVATVTPDGIVAGAVAVAQKEPILVLGITNEDLAAYIASFKGFDIRASGLRPRATRSSEAPRILSGATVTSAVIRHAIVRSARAVIHSQSAASSTSGKVRLDRETLRRSSWRELMTEGSLRNLILSRGEAARLLGSADAEPDKTFIELWVAVATPPAIGESLVGRRVYNGEIARIGPDDDLILIAANGLYSFKGTEWRRSGIFDRFELIQHGKTILLRAEDHVTIDRLHAAGAPEFREIGLYRIAQGKGLDTTAPFRLELAIASPRANAGPITLVTVSLDYTIPDKYLIKTPAAHAARGLGAENTSGAVNASAEGMPTRAPAAADETRLWQEIWSARRIELAVLALMLGALATLLIFQNAATAHERFYQWFRIGYLSVTVVFLGGIANAQLSVVQVITFVHAFLAGFRWELFLLDPIVFSLWSFVAVSMLFWGRGVFCGWLCPFGALQELLNKLAQRIGLRQIDLPFGLHERLWMCKYILFLGIFAVSLNSVTTAFQMAEVEPFKTAITLKFSRAWPFVVYAGALLIIGLFVQRFFCRYLCPLGAALALPARLRMFEWLKRYRECGSECHICARRCTVQAIHPLGQINPNECIYCLQCQAHYFNPNVCLHLKKRLERRRPASHASARSLSTSGAADAG